MENDLTMHLAQRQLLLTSDEADLAQLKRHDRELLAAMEQGLLTAPLALEEVSDEAIFEALAEDFEGTVLMLEARARLWPGELLRIQNCLIGNEAGETAAWWLAAHYPALPCPSGFPEPWVSQSWAARALRRRGQEEALPEPWRIWAKAMAGEGEVQPAAEALWALSEGRDWEPWLAPLIAVADNKPAVMLINWLMARVDDQVIIKMMGLSGQSRFLPWLASMQQNAELANTATRELQWLTGGQESHYDGRQCWGREISEEIWPQLFRSVPLGFRGRLWHWCGDRVEGAANSLQGGRWCAGN